MGSLQTHSLLQQKGSTYGLWSLRKYKRGGRNATIGLGILRIQGYFRQKQQVGNQRGSVGYPKRGCEPSQSSRSGISERELQRQSLLGVLRILPKLHLRVIKRSHGQTHDENPQIRGGGAPEEQIKMSMIISILTNKILYI